jgi:hypothetical protein
MRAMLMFMAAVSAAGCAFVPAHNVRLEEAWEAVLEARGEARVALLAPRELAGAGEALIEAESARNTLQDVALIDHLAYIARRRAAIAREAAMLRGQAW